MHKQVTYWFETADDDLITAQALFDAGRYLWMGYICQLIIEKGFKARICKCGNTPPKIHNLFRLAELSDVHDFLTEQQIHFMAELMPLQIDGRYPTYKHEIEKQLDRNYCAQLLQKTREMLLWIKQQP